MCTSSKRPQAFRNQIHKRMVGSQKHPVGANALIGNDRFPVEVMTFLKEDIKNHSTDTAIYTNAVV